MPNKKITSLNINTNPTLGDVFPIVNNGETKQLSLSGLTEFIAPMISMPFTGGTVSGETNFTAGLTANTISATTYYNLPPTPPSLADLGFIVRPRPITQDVTLPEETDVVYIGQINIGSGYTITVPNTTTLTII